MRIIKFDTEGMANNCPISDIGVATSTDCQDCDWFIRFVGFDVECGYDEPEIPEQHPEQLP